MNFSPIPAYLDPPNCQQQWNNPLGISSGARSQLFPAPPTPLPPQTQQAQSQGASGSGSLRAGSMVDTARMANVPMPETTLKCPRCESANTKFCYFNNYSLSQPRHFCKTCTRYWTRGGAMRNVPVGGVCRRNKRSKASSSRSPVSSTNSISSNTAYTTTAELLGLTSHMPPSRFMTPMISHHSTEFAPGEMRLSHGLSYDPVSSASGLEQWRLQETQQFPLLAALETSSTGLYPFEAHDHGPG